MMKKKVLVVMAAGKGRIVSRTDLVGFCQMLKNVSGELVGTIHMINKEGTMDSKIMKKMYALILRESIDYVFVSCKRDISSDDEAVFDFVNTVDLLNAKVVSLADDLPAVCNLNGGVFDILLDDPDPKAD